jgi:hypothetical protein
VGRYVRTGTRHFMTFCGQSLCNRDLLIELAPIVTDPAHPPWTPVTPYEAKSAFKIRLLFKDAANDSSVKKTLEVASYMAKEAWEFARNTVWGLSFVRNSALRTRLPCDQIRRQGFIGVSGVLSSFPAHHGLPLVDSAFVCEKKEVSRRTTHQF